MSRLLSEMLNEVHAKEKQAVEEAFKSNQMELNKEGYYQLKESLEVRSNGTAYWWDGHCDANPVVSPEFQEEALSLLRQKEEIDAKISALRKKDNAKRDEEYNRENPLYAKDIWVPYRIDKGKNGKPLKYGTHTNRLYGKQDYDRGQWTDDEWAEFGDQVKQAYKDNGLEWKD